MKKAVDPRVTRAVEVYKQEIERVGPIWGVDLSKIPLKVAPRRGRLLGQAKVCGYAPSLSSIWINQNYFNTFKNYNHILNETITHELAHVANSIKYGAGVQPHGNTWKMLMRAAGKNPSRLAEDIDPHTEAKSNTLVARCECGARLLVTKRKWNRRECYSHAKCGALLTKAVLIGWGEK